MNEEWELSDVPDLLQEIIRLNQRLVDEQTSTIKHLEGTERGKYMYEDVRQDEYRRLRENIRIARECVKIYEDALVEFTKQQIKKNESKEICDNSN